MKSTDIVQPKFHKEPEAMENVIGMIEKSAPETFSSVDGSGADHNGRQSRRFAPAIPGEYMTLINRDYVFEFVSDSYCSALGKSRQDIAKNSVANIWGQETFNKVIKKCLDRCFAGEEVQFEGWIEFPGRGRRYYHVSHYPYCNEQGEVTHAAVASRDITEHKQEEETLQKSQAHFRAILKSMHFGVYSFDTEGRFTFVNDVVLERTGYSREWFTKTSLFDFVRSEERKEVRKHFETSIRGVPVPPYEFAYAKESGDISWVQVNTTPIWEKGRVVGVLGVLLDITKRKRSEQALRESEEKYRMLFEDSKDAIFITDRKGRLTDANRSFLDLFGYSREKVKGLDVINTYANPEDRKICVQAIQEKGFVKDFELKLKKKNGTVIDCQLTGNARRADDGAILSYQGIVRDITKQRRIEEALQDSEEKLKNIVYGSPVPQFVIDKNHTVTLWNRALELVSGIKAEEVVGTKQHWKAFYREQRPCIVDLLVEETFTEIPNWYQGENGASDVVDGAYNAMDFFQDLEGGGKWLCFTGAVIRDSRGNITGAVETLEDITEHKLAEEAIRKAEERCRSILQAVSPHQL